MVAKVKKEAKPVRWQTHVYLSEDDSMRLKQIAEQESRSATMQIEYFLRWAIAAHTHWRRKVMSKTEEGIWAVKQLGLDAELADNLIEIVQLSVSAGRAEAIEECAKIADFAYNLMFPKPANRITAENAGHAVAAAIRALASGEGKDHV